jgi:hypothetical protein
VAMCKRLPDEKLDEVRRTLTLFQVRKRDSKHQLQSLAGLLAWCAHVVQGVRVFLRRMLDVIAKLQRKHHRVVIPQTVRLDFICWQKCMEHFNGKALIIDTEQSLTFFTDACTVAAGGWCREDWFYSHFPSDRPAVTDLHINEKELLAAARWGHVWKDRRVVVYSDNTVTVSALNRGTSQSLYIMACLGGLF